MLDEIRIALRDLIIYVDIEKQEVVYTNFEDEIDFEGIKIRDRNYSTDEDLNAYKDRVETYIRNNKDHLTIRKLKKNIPITKEELDEIEKMFFTESVAGSKKQFEQQYGKSHWEIY